MFVPERGCEPAPTCEVIGRAPEAVCEASGGVWELEVCGHSVCGHPNDPTCTPASGCRCERGQPKPGCDCGAGKVFLSDRGCTPSWECGERCDGSAPDELGCAGERPSWVFEWGWELGSPKERYTAGEGAVLWGVARGAQGQPDVCVSVVWAWEQLEGKSVSCGANPPTLFWSDTTEPCEPMRGVKHRAVDASGCASFLGLTGGLHWSDMWLKSSGEGGLRGLILSNMRAQGPAIVPVVWEARQTPGELTFTQTVGHWGVPEWALVEVEGRPASLLDVCDVPYCGEAAPRCAGKAWEVAQLLPGSAQRAEAGSFWDGLVRVLREEGCVEVRALPVGEYESRYCVSTSIQDAPEGQRLQAPTCAQRRWAWPTNILQFSDPREP